MDLARRPEAALASLTALSERLSVGVPLKTHRRPPAVTTHALPRVLGEKQRHRRSAVQKSVPATNVTEDPLTPFTSPTPSAPSVCITSACQDTELVPSRAPKLEE